MTIEGKEIPA